MASRFVRSIKNVKNIKNYPVDDNVTEINDIINDEAGNVYIRTAKNYDKLNNGQDVEKVQQDVKDTQEDLSEIKTKQNEFDKDLKEVNTKQKEQDEALALHESQLKAIDSDNINQMQEKLNQINVDKLNELNQIDVNDMNQKFKSVDTLNKKIKEIDTLNTKINNIYQMQEKDGTRHFIDKPTDVKTLKAGYYELTTENKPEAYGLPTDIGDGFVEVDVLKGKENRTQIYVTKSSNNTSWQKTIHTNGQENDWKQVVK